MFPKNLQVRGRRRAMTVPFTALAIAALAMLTPAGAAHAATATYDMYDINADGWIDPSAVDTNDDRLLDSNLVDTNGDGQGDIWLIDLNRDRLPEWFLVDSAPRDGRFETLGADSDENGVVEAAYGDADGNGVPDVLPAGVSVPTPYVNPACAVTPGGCRYGSGANTGGSVALPDGVSIATGLNNLDSAATNMSGVG
jgi:hypothetical protein